MSKDNLARERTLREIEKLDLNDNLRELLALGYTIIPGVLSERQLASAKAAILRRVERETGTSVDPDTATADEFHGMNYQHYLLFDDPIFSEILLEPKPLALITYLLGESCLLSSMGSHFRGPGGIPLPMHADAPPVGMSDVSLVANCNYALTPYTREGGALTITPGSHLKQRQPTAQENFMVGSQTFQDVMAQGHGAEALATLEWSEPPEAVVIEANPGDAIIFQGNTWHGGWRRDLPGTRINLAAYFCRRHITPQERRGDQRFPELFERHADNPRFARLLAEGMFHGWREEGPDYSRMANEPTGLFD